MGATMATYNQATNTYTLEAETDFTLQPADGNANVIGNDQDNRITGNDANNILDGGLGADTLRGGLGNDTYILNGNDVIEGEGEDGGIDEIVSGASIKTNLAASLAFIENITLIGNASAAQGNTLANHLVGNSVANLLHGREGDDRLEGGDGNDELHGEDGNDTLDGGGGADALWGGSGNDTYILNDDPLDPNDDDVIMGEVENGGIDTIETSTSIDLFGIPGYAFIENVTLTGTAGVAATGNGLDNHIIGNSGSNLLDGGGGNDGIEGGDEADQLYGSDGNDTLDGGAGNDFMDGGLGDDTFVVDTATDQVSELADEGHDRVFASVSFTLNVNGGLDVEELHLTETGISTNIDGTGNDLDNRIVGNSGANHLFGLDGADTLDGGAGADVLDGGYGNDTYYIDENDTILEGSDASAGADIVFVAGALNFTLAGTNLEHVRLTSAGTATGNDVSNDLRGSDGNDGLNGGKGNDWLEGGRGADALIGAEGDDTYVVDSDLDTVNEAAGEGNDRVLASATFTLGANVEYLQLTETAHINGTGNGLDNDVFGNDGNNKLYGLDGDDTIGGGGGSDTLYGGAGADAMTGGTGDDTYVIDEFDELHENEGQGRDTVEANSNYTLLANFEDLTLTGSAANGTGNTQNNFIRGNAGANTLVGLEGDDSLMGGAGADRMEGGAGSDLYWVDNAGDVIVEAGAGFDRVLASGNYTLGANLEYLAFEGTGNFTGKGNELDNYLYGNTGANTLEGGAGRDQLDGGVGNDKLLGGDGDDTINDWRGDDVIDGGAGRDDLRGGVGNDTYYVDALDLVTELAGQGTDTVTASASFSLGASAEVEALLAQAGTAKINLSGSDTANTVTGNNGANLINGRGGNDILTGGKGKDRFVFDTAADSKLNADRILDFKAADDTIALENAVFTKLGKKTGTLKASMFHIGKKAHDKDDRVIYDKGTGSVYYDADGTGKTKAVKFATVKKGIFMGHDDFLVI
jgi:Ca2+-binding RTX toxin-like protein